MFKVSSILTDTAVQSLLLMADCSGDDMRQTGRCWVSSVAEAKIQREATEMSSRRAQTTTTANSVQIWSHISSLHPDDLQNSKGISLSKVKCFHGDPTSFPEMWAKFWKNAISCEICWIHEEIPGSGSGCRWSRKFNQFFLVHRLVW